MSDKVKTQITKVVVNGNTYSKEPFNPTLINFLFGKNGTGKSTIAEYMYNAPASDLTWDPLSDSSIKREIFNEEYIRLNVQSYGNIPGVFTISEADAKAQKELDDKTAEKKKVDEDTTAAGKARDDAKDAVGKYELEFTEKMWGITDDYRRKYGDALSYTRNKAKFQELLMSKSPEEQDMGKVDALYQTVYVAGEKPTYKTYGLISQINRPSSPLPGTPIISHSDAPFAKFVQRLGNLDWVKAGHDQYHENADGCCPYCSREFPKDFDFEGK